MGKIFEKNKVYSLNGQPVVFISQIDGINTFKLELDKKLFFFYHLGKKKTTVISEFDKKNAEILTEEQLPSDIEKISDELIQFDESEFYRFVFTAKPKFPNSAFCPENMLNELFEKKGIIFDETSKLSLEDKFRAINPDYCLIKSNEAYRQVDMRENYPDFFLKHSKFDINIFVNSSVFKDDKEIYIRAKSSESYGGNHKDYSDWLKNTIGEYNDYIQDFKMASFKRIFTIKKDKIHFFKKIDLSDSKIVLLKKSI